MFFSFTGLLTVNIFISLLIAMLGLCLKNNRFIKQIGFGTLFFFSSIVILRLFIPTEFTFSESLGIKYIIPEITSFLRKIVWEYGNYKINVIDILYFLWGVGGVFHLVKTLFSYYRFKQFLDSIPAVQNEKVHNILSSVLQNYTRHVRFKIIHTNTVSTPMLFGIKNPVIILPIMDLEEEDLFYILSHEVAHYYNYNLYMKILTEILYCIYWWNPFILLLKKQVNKLIEIHTDVTVTGSLTPHEQVKYLECLLKIAKKPLIHRPNKLSLTFDCRKSSVLVQRFQMVLGDDPNIKSSKKNILLKIMPALLMLFILFFSFTIVIEPHHIAPQDEATTVELTSENSFLVKNTNGEYAVYLNNKFYATVNNVKQSFVDLPVYNNLEEAYNNEEKR